MATRKQFLALQKKAESLGRRVLAVYEDDSYYSGAFIGNEYRPDIGAKGPLFKPIFEPLVKWEVVFSEERRP